ncbi:lipopolysaccharide-induced tumor necrosis factor-alpha factor homolog [Onthophagus taurus]|uniref:lipopolysaccharide-induced tumor necrosis factor-alpha factor homolog n=1 Tax=Onthophagus taurus TaxID=166361 RepID=UPI000C20CF08|nr:lipopolysaccharide-induced tumor necrosis factor-alpha factor homolog [Onthophagus taurus]
MEKPSPSLYATLETEQMPALPSAPPVNQMQATVFAAHIPMVQYGPKSQNATCPLCNHVIHTRIRSKATTRTHLWACLLSPCLCCCIPHCMTTCVNTNHYCPNCDHFLGTYQS